MAARRRVVCDRYRLLERLGDGGMGSVWLAEDLLLRRRVALKRLVEHLDRRELDRHRKRIVREAQALARLSHPSIVQIYDIVTERGDPWIVMEYVRGRSLADVIDARRLDAPTTAEIGLHVLGALQAAHKAGVLHRDVKPSNIIVGDDGKVFLVDFGVAHITDADSITTGRVLLGTIEYLAPERLAGSPAGPLADLWSLGVTFYYALEGHSPFRRGGDRPTAATMWAIMNDPPPPLGTTGPLADAVLRLLDKQPEQRMTAGVLELTLRSIMDGVRSSPPGAPRPVGDGSAPPRQPAQHDVQRDASRTERSVPARPRAGGARPARPGGQKPKRPRASPALDPAEDRVKGPAQGRAENPDHGRGSDGRRLPDMSPDETAAELSERSAEVIRARLAGLDRTFAGEVLLALPGEKAANVLDTADRRTAGRLLDAVASRPADASAIIRRMSAARTSRAIPHMARARAANLMSALPTAIAVCILRDTDQRVVADILALLPSAMACRQLEAMSINRACAVLNHVPPVTTAGLLRECTDGRADRLLRGLGGSIRTQVLRHLS